MPAGRVFEAGELDLLRKRALARWLISSRAGGGWPDARNLVTVRVEHEKGKTLLAVTSRGGEVLARYRASFRGGRPSLARASASPARALRSAASTQVTTSEALRSRVWDPSARSRAVRWHSATLLARSRAQRSGSAGTNAWSRTARARSAALRVRSRTVCATCEAQVERALALGEQSAGLTGPARADAARVA